jgi:hypothetical protein
MSTFNELGPGNPIELALKALISQRFTYAYESEQRTKEKIRRAIKVHCKLATHASELGRGIFPHVKCRVADSDQAHLLVPASNRCLQKINFI